MSKIAPPATLEDMVVGSESSDTSPEYIFPVTRADWLYLAPVVPTTPVKPHPVMEPNPFGLIPIFPVTEEFPPVLSVVMPVSPRITKVPAVPRVSAVGLENTGGHIDVAVAVAVAVGVGVKVVVEVVEDVRVGVFVGVEVTRGVFVDVEVAAVVGPVVGFQFPQPAAMNRTGLTARRNIKRNLLFTIRNTFFVLKNMIPLFFFRLTINRTAHAGRSNLKITTGNAVRQLT